MLWTLRQIFLFCASRPSALAARQLLLWPVGVWPWRPRPSVTAVPGRGCGEGLLAVPFAAWRLMAGIRLLARKRSQPVQRFRRLFGAFSV